MADCAAPCGRRRAARKENPLLATTLRVPGAILTERAHSVPLDHSQPDGAKITVFTRELAAPDGLDLDEPIYMLNSSGSNFYTTLAQFLDWSAKTGGTPEETLRLREALGRQHCIAQQELEPFWMNFIYATLERDPKNLVVTLGPMTAEPGAACAP